MQLIPVHTCCTTLYTLYTILYNSYTIAHPYTLCTLRCTHMLHIPVNPVHFVHYIVQFVHNCTFVYNLSDIHYAAYSCTLSHHPVEYINFYLFLYITLYTHAAHSCTLCTLCCTIRTPIPTVSYTTVMTFLYTLDTSCNCTFLYTLYTMLYNL